MLLLNTFLYVLELNKYTNIVKHKLVTYYTIYIQHVQKKKIIGKTGCFFPKQFLNSKINCVSMPFKNKLGF